jgi:methionyl aminopeptidase
MIIYKSSREIEKMRVAGAMVKKTLDLLSENIRPGITTIELDDLADDFIRSQGGKPSFKGYNGFPASICTSINDEIVHGIPGNRKVEEGQVIGIDVGVYKDGYHGDGAWTFAVGAVDDETRRLLAVGQQCLEYAIKAVRVGNFIGDVSHAIQSHAEKNGYSVVRDLVGHGIGQKMHEEPQVPNYGRPHSGVSLKAGLVIAIEPMVNAGAYQIKMLNDNWTIVTTDGKKSVHFEHTIAVTENGPLILTG